MVKTHLQLLGNEHEPLGTATVYENAGRWRTISLRIQLLKDAQAPLVNRQQLGAPKGCNPNSGKENLHKTSLRNS